MKTLEIREYYLEQLRKIGPEWTPEELKQLEEMGIQIYSTRGPKHLYANLSNKLVNTP